MNAHPHHPLVLARQTLQSAILASSQILANKTRALLTSAGIVIGVASVTAVIAALTGMKANVLSEFETLGTNKIYIVPDRPRTGPMKSASAWQMRFAPAEFKDLTLHCPSVSAFSRMVSNTRDVSYRGHIQEAVAVTGVDESWHKIENRFVIEGRPFSLIDGAQARPVCLINSKLRDKLNMPGDCIGQSLYIGASRLNVLGVLESRAESSMYGGGSELELVLPFASAWRLFGSDGYIVGLASSRSPELSEDACAELNFFLRKERRLKPGQPNNFRLDVIEQYLRQFQRVSGTTTMIAGSVVAISLLVGGVGIMNIMLVSVSERTREIGLRKAIGARPSAILLQFLVEAMMLCLFGGALGLLLGQALTCILRYLPGAGLSRAAIPMWAVLVAFGFSAGVGLIFGFFPAVKASRLDPIEALRHE